MQLSGKRRKRCRRHFRWFGRRHGGNARDSISGSTLKDVLPGEMAYINRYSAAVTGEQRAHLHAYGLVPGHAVQILQQKPVTIVLVEHLELALEHNLAREIQVNLIDD